MTENLVLPLIERIMNYKTNNNRFVSAILQAFKPAIKTSRFLLSVMVPVSFGMFLLDIAGLLTPISNLLTPLMKHLSLPGEAALVFLSSILLNIYSAIAIIQTINLTHRQLIIIAVMCLIAHNLLVECAVMHKTGSSFTKMLLLRITMAIFAAWTLHYILPDSLFSMDKDKMLISSIQESHLTTFNYLKEWGIQTILLMLKVIGIVTGIMILQKLLEEYGILTILGKSTASLMKFLGLSKNCGFVWIVANFIGLAYGSVLMIEQVETGKLSLSESDLFNHHVAISHSLLEDTLLFISIGVPLFWAIVPRFIVAVAVVWIEHLRRIIFSRCT